MRKLFLTLITVLLWINGTWLFGYEQTLTYGRFGNVTIYGQSNAPSHVVIFVSGDGGWNRGVIGMAKELAANDSIVVGVDIVHYLKELAIARDPCSYPAADFEMLSKFIQRKLGLSSYEIPILVGYSSGATLVYAVLAQAPPNTFGGAISMGFCPDLTLAKPLCKGYGLEYTFGAKNRTYNFLPVKNLRNPWVALQGDIDQVCDPVSTENFVKNVKNGRIIMLPKVGHGFSVQKNWMPQFKTAFQELVKEKPDQIPSKIKELEDLPLVELPAPETDSDILSVIISGDGGWAGIDRDLAETLVSRQIPVVGLDSLHYFWTRRTPEGAAQDLARIIRYYCRIWNKHKILLIGYSMGADVLPFMADRLPEDLLERVKLIALLGPGEKASFEFHLSDWIGVSSHSESRPIYPEIVKLKGYKILCFSGEEEEDSLCRKLDNSLSETIVMKGSHHFGGDYVSIADNILKRLK